MTRHEALLNKAAMKAELHQIADGLKKGQCLPSHLWFIIEQPGIAKGEWTTDNMESFLDAIAHSYLDEADHKLPGATLYVAWSDEADKNPMLDAEDNARNNMLAEESTAVNAADFFLAYKQNTSLSPFHREVAVVLATYVWRNLIDREQEDCVIDLLKSLVANLAAGAGRDLPRRLARFVVPGNALLTKQHESETFTLINNTLKKETQDEKFR